MKSNGGNPSAAIYARVSTAEQSTAAQVERLTAYCQGQGWAAPRVFADDGISGVADHRPQLDKLRQLIQAGEVTVVVVSKMDRLGRSLGMILRLWDEADAAGARIVVTDQAIDTSTPGGRLQRNMLAALSEFERELILERTRAGIERARAKGVRFGRPPKLSGEQRAEILRRLSNGESSRSVSMAMKIPSGTVRWVGQRRRLETPSQVLGASDPRGTRAGR